MATHRGAWVAPLWGMCCTVTLAYLLLPYFLLGTHVLSIGNVSEGNNAPVVKDLAFLWRKMDNK